MTLRVIKRKPIGFTGPAADDTWATRVGKLIPGEALGLYGAGLPIIPDHRTDALWILVAACLALSIWLRYLATRGEDGKPQPAAIGIAAISFLLWVCALEPPAGPLSLGENAFLVALAALIWGTAVPYFYEGD